MKKKLLKKGISFILSAFFVLSSFSTAYASAEVINRNVNLYVGNEKNDSKYVTNFDNRSDDEIIATINNTVDSNNSIAPMSLSNDGYYENYTGYFSAQGQNAWVDIALYPGEILHCQMDVPNTSQVDYDLYLYETSDDFMTLLSLVDYSEYSTYINGTSGSLSEAVGIINTSNQIEYYTICAYSYMGSSLSMPFTLHVGINDNYDLYETDENIWTSLQLTLNSTNNTIVDIRSLDTLIDNDWYFFTVPSGLSYNSVNLSLDNASVNAGYKVEIYTEQSNGGMKKEINPFSLAAGKTHLIRVSAESANYLTGSNYTLTIKPENTGGGTTPSTGQVKITNVSGFDSATYNSATRYRINQNSTATFTGQVLDNNGNPVANAEVIVYIENTDISSTSPNRLKKSNKVYTDSNGAFTTTVTTGYASGINSAYLSGAIPFWHYYDNGKFYAETGNVRSSETKIYLFAYSIKA